MNEPLDMDEQNQLNTQNAELRQQVRDLEAECARLRNAVKSAESQLWHVRAYMREQGMRPHEEITHAS